MKLLCEPQIYYHTPRKKSRGNLKFFHVFPPAAKNPEIGAAHRRGAVGCCRSIQEKREGGVVIASDSVKYTIFQPQVVYRL